MIKKYKKGDEVIVKVGMGGGGMSGGRNGGGGGVAGGCDGGVAGSGGRNGGRDCTFVILNSSYSCCTNYITFSTSII